MLTFTHQWWWAWWSGKAARRPRWDVLPSGCHRLCCAPSAIWWHTCLGQAGFQIFPDRWPDAGQQGYVQDTPCARGPQTPREGTPHHLPAVEEESWILLVHLCDLFTITIDYVNQINTFLCRSCKVPHIWWVIFISLHPFRLRRITGSLLKPLSGHVDNDVGEKAEVFSLNH